VQRGSLEKRTLRSILFSHLKGKEIQEIYNKNYYDIYDEIDKNTGVDNNEEMEVFENSTEYSGFDVENTKAIKGMGKTKKMQEMTG